MGIECPFQDQKVLDVFFLNFIKQQRNGSLHNKVSIYLGVGSPMIELNNNSLVKWKPLHYIELGTG